MDYKCKLMIPIKKLLSMKNWRFIDLTLNVVFDAYSRGGFQKIELNFLNKKKMLNFSKCLLN